MVALRLSILKAKCQSSVGMPSLDTCIDRPGQILTALFILIRNISVISYVTSSGNTLLSITLNDKSSSNSLSFAILANFRISAGFAALQGFSLCMMCSGHQVTTVGPSLMATRHHTLSSSLELSSFTTVLKIKLVFTSEKTTVPF